MCRSSHIQRLISLNSDMAAHKTVENLLAVVPRRPLQKSRKLQYRGSASCYSNGIMGTDDRYISRASRNIETADNEGTGKIHDCHRNFENNEKTKKNDVALNSHASRGACFG